MSKDFGPAITGIGVHLPEESLNNDEINRRLGTKEDWYKKVGIRTRRIAPEHTTASSLAIPAAIAALEIARLKPSDLDHIIVATTTPDAAFPSTAAKLQRKLGADHAASWDISAACSGGLFGLAHSFAMHRLGFNRGSLVVGSEILSKITNPKDHSTASLFGDAAGAVAIQTIENPGVSLFRLHTDTTHQDSLTISRDQIAMEGRVIYEEAIRHMTTDARALLEEAGLKPRDLRLLVPHQANIRIMNKVGDNLGLTGHQRHSTIDRHGNTSAASIFLALEDAHQNRKLAPGDPILLVALGAGLTHGAALINWHIPTPPARNIIDKAKDLLHIR